MNRLQLEHAIRTACQIIRRPEVIIVGSQAILGSYDESLLPIEATMSRECDVLPVAETNEEACRLADLIEGVAGEWSPFESEHGFSIDGVDLTTVVLPEGWRSRLVKVSNANTAGPTGEPRFTGWCLEPHDLCASKRIAAREKDLHFVRALLVAGMIEHTNLASRLSEIPDPHERAALRAQHWLSSFHEANKDRVSGSNEA